MKMMKPELKGRMVFMEGFAPGKDFAIAGDVALLPSRFAPCELTDLEAKKYLCTPIVPNVGGMAQKNFDPSIPEEAAKMDAYKGKHEFYMTEEEALKSVNENAKKEFETAKGLLVKEYKTKYKKQVNEEMPEELVKQYLEGDERYTQKALRKLRDEVISDEMADCLERALITDRNGKNAEQILKHQVDADTTWFGNSWLSKTGKSSGDLYQEYHFNNKGKNLSKADLISLDFTGLGQAARGGKAGGSLMGGFKGKTAKIAAAVTAGVAILGGLGYVGYKKEWFSPKFEKEEQKSGDLSCVG